MKITVKLDTEGLSKKAIIQLLDTANREHEIPVTIGFNQNQQVGKVFSAKLVRGDVIVDIEIDDVPETHALKAEIGGIIKRSHFEGSVRVIDEFDLNNISVGFSWNT